MSPEPEKRVVTNAGCYGRADGPTQHFFRYGAPTCGCGLTYDEALAQLRDYCRRRREAEEMGWP